MDRSHINLLVVSLLIISALSSVVFFTEGTEGAAFIGPPSRTIYQESEANNDWNNADQLTSSGSYELHGNLSSSSDIDFFEIDLNGGSGPVDMFTISPNWFNMTGSNDLVVVWISAFYPDSTTENVIIVNYYDQDQVIIFWRDMSFYASYTGTYGIRFEPYNLTTGTSGIRGNLEYNFTISISSEVPVDNTNDQGSSLQLSSGSGTISSNMNVVRDMMDWYYIPAPDPLHPTTLDMSVSLNSPYPDFTSSSVYYGIEMDVFVKYNSRSNPGSFQTDLHRISTGSVFQSPSVGCDPSPKDITLKKNCTEMYIGLLIKSYGVNPSSPTGRTYQIMTEGRTSYGINYEISANIPNQRPQLFTAQVEPSIGISSTSFTFSVIYRDPQNETPKEISLWKDGEFYRSMTKSDDSGSDYSVGVLFDTEVSGSQIGPDGDYSFNISATDGKDWARDPLSGMRNFNIRIDNNLGPSTDGSELVPIRVMEDPETVWKNLDETFIDLDNGKLTYSIWNDFKGSWVMDLDLEDYRAIIVNNGTELAPEWRLKVDFEENVIGFIYIKLNATDDATFAQSVVVDLVFNVIGVNDPPHIDRINSIKRGEFGNEFRITEDQNDLVEIKIDASDIDEEDELSFFWTIGEILHNAQRGVNFDWNETSGDLWFITSDGDVPGFETTLTVSDGKGGYDEIELVVSVNNENDPPWIIIPKTKSTIEGAKLFINPVFNDPDLDSNDIVTFSYSLGALERYTHSSAIEFSQSTGRLVLEARSEEMNGNWEINITIVDNYGEADWGICQITIDNVNDPPVAYPINVDQEDGNLEVIFHTLEGDDEDAGETLTYIWDFGDGSDPLQGVDLRSATHAFPSEGAYTVTLTIFDGEASSEVEEIIIKVTAPPPNPDIDGDGMLTVWEDLYGLDPTDPSDADLDFDDDGLTNLQEFKYFEDNGVYLNPWNPDTDEDGVIDGKEIDKGYDPLDPESHPEDPNKDFILLLWLGAIVLVVLMFLSLMVFFIMRIRNKPKPVAASALPIPAYDNALAPGYYDQIPPADMEMLPPAETGYDQVTYDQNYLPSQDQQWDQQNQQDQYAQQAYDQYPVEGTVPEQMQDVQQMNPPEPEIYGYQDPSPPEPVDTGDQQPTFEGSLSGVYQEPVPEPVPPSAGDLQEPPQISTPPEPIVEPSAALPGQTDPDQKVKEQEKKEEDPGLPPPPSLPDL